MSNLTVERIEDRDLPAGRLRWAIGASALTLVWTAMLAIPASSAAAPSVDPYSWTETPIGQPGLMIEDVDAADGVAWAVGSESGERLVALRRDGDTWTDATPDVSGANLVEVAVAAADDVWAVGWDGSADEGMTSPLVLHWDGTTWAEIPSPAEIGAFDDVVVDAEGTVWVTGWARIGSAEPAVVYQYADGEWTEYADGLEGAINGNSLTVLAPDDAWLALNPGLAHFDGTSWTMVEEFPADGSQILSGIAAVDATDIWAAGHQYTGGAIQPIAWHYDGSEWSEVPTPNVSAQVYDVTIVEGHPVVVGEELDRDWASTPLVLTTKAGAERPGLVQVAGPTTDAVVLTSADADAGRLWVAGGNIDVFTGFAAYTELP
ncbi:beta propeller repeat protein [Streptomyces litchfieldiae]|uniref:Uncharacterized protein n=1 Tax=Streptomyces litchfieldiae TaxID=3075543 RepID=A0ABU2MTJ4_9ACTN|nr:hypothetical protein [Streptomyces sp. DSM 44938]MDT0344961.1 hypothetical protein [Streptomyces sp. DSM 44938]